MQVGSLKLRLKVSSFASPRCGMVGKLLCRFLMEVCRRCAKINSKSVWSSGVDSKKKRSHFGQVPLATPSQHHHSSSTHGISGISTIFPAVCSSAVFATTCAVGILLCLTTGTCTFGTSMTFSTNLGRDSTLSCVVLRYPRSLQPGNLNIIRVVQKELPQSSRCDNERLTNERTLFFQLRRRARAMKC